MLHAEVLGAPRPRDTSGEPHYRYGDDPAAILTAGERIAGLTPVWLRAAAKRYLPAVATLTVRERNLLRQHLVDGSTIDDLARLHRVHRATAARWLVSARAWSATVSALEARLAITPESSPASSWRCAPGST